MPIHPQTQLKLVWTTEDAMELLRWLGERRDGPVTFDTETTGLNPGVDHIRLVQFGDKMTGWSIPFEGNRSFRALVPEVFERWDGYLAAHNSNFDWAFLWMEGIELPTHRIHDTRLMAAVLESEYSNALKSQASRHVDKKAAGASSQLSEVMAKNGWTWATIPITNDPKDPAYIYHIYGSLDTVLTAHLFDVHYPRVLAECPKAYDLELGAAWSTRRMSLKGITCDREFTQQKYDAFDKYVADSAVWIKKTWGCAPGSTAKVIEALEEDGALLSKLTPGGSLSLDREVLESLAGDHPLAAAVLKRRRTEKAKSFMANFLKFSEHDGRLHPSINSVGGTGKSTGESGGAMGVKTSRMSTSDPNLQALPRVGDGNPAADVVRNCLTASPGNTLVMVDYSQIELRLAASFSGDEGLCNAFGHEIDAFTAIARQIYRDENLTKKDPRRNTTKNAVYAKTYGAGVNTFSATAKISPADGKAFMDKFDQTFPGLKRLMGELTRAARTEGFVLSPVTGRRIKAEYGLEYKLLNHKIQTTAAEVLKRSILRADAAGLREYMILPVHDEIILDVPDDMVPEAVRILSASMEDLTTFKVPMTVDASTGKRLGSKTQWLA